MIVYTQANTPIDLSDKPLSKGGEGSVYELKNYPGRVAKLYNTMQDAAKRESKITEMVRFSKTASFQNARIARHIAWPLAPLYDAKRRFIGFGMQKIKSAYELDQLYEYPPKRPTASPLRTGSNALSAYARPSRRCTVRDRSSEISTPTTSRSTPTALLPLLTRIPTISGAASGSTDAQSVSKAMPLRR